MTQVKELTGVNHRGTGTYYNGEGFLQSRIEALEEVFKTPKYALTKESELFKTYRNFYTKVRQDGEISEAALTRLKFFKNIVEKECSDLTQYVRRDYINKVLNADGYSLDVLEDELEDMFTGIIFYCMRPKKKGEDKSYKQIESEVYSAMKQATESGNEEIINSVFALCFKLGRASSYFSANENESIKTMAEKELNEIQQSLNVNFKRP